MPSPTRTARSTWTAISAASVVMRACPQAAWRSADQWRTPRTRAPARSRETSTGSIPSDSQPVSSVLERSSCAFAPARRLAPLAAGCRRTRPSGPASGSDEPVDLREALLPDRDPGSRPGRRPSPRSSAHSHVSSGVGSRKSDRTKTKLADGTARRWRARNSNIVGDARRRARRAPGARGPRRAAPPSARRAGTSRGRRLARRSPAARSALAPRRRCPRSAPVAIRAAAPLRSNGRPGGQSAICGAAVDARRRPAAPRRRSARARRTRRSPVRRRAGPRPPSRSVRDRRPERTRASPRCRSPCRAASPCIAPNASPIRRRRETSGKVSDRSRSRSAPGSARGSSSRAAGGGASDRHSSANAPARRPCPAAALRRASRA